VKRFGSISPFLEQGAAERRIGRLVANHDFVKALLRFGSFDEYVLANPSVANQRDFLAVVDQWALPDERRRRIRPLALVDLPAAVERDTFHVFHVGGWGAFMPGLHALRARYARQPWPITGMIFSVHGRDILDAAVRVCGSGLAPWDAIVCLSRDGRDAFARLLDRAGRLAGRAFPGRLEPLPLGVDDDVLDARGDRAAGRRRLQAPEGTVVLLVLGRLTPSQKMDLAPLVKTFAHVIRPRASRPVLLVLAGGASDADLRLTQQIVESYGAADAVRIHANFMSRVKADLLAAADIAVSVTDNTQETFGLSLVESLGHGLPVVASRFDGYKDLVSDGEDGFLVDTYWCAADPLAELADVSDPNIAQLVQAQSVAVDLDQLADRVLRLVNDEALRAAMGARGRGKVDRAYRFSAVIRRYEALWDELADACRGKPVPAAQGEAWSFSPADVFSGYPARTLSGRDRVEAVNGATLDPPYSEVAPLLEPGLLTSVMARARAPVAIDDLIAGAAASDRAWFTIMWLLKYGALRVSS
jgi:glycosyltransferase involved in cell wall biosynthesis